MWAGPFVPISFVVVLTVTLLIQASVIRRYGEGDDTPAAPRQP
ncbi:hypothetical protein [Geodermatophilus maliterrae]|uniref:Uncharacterized protein n=1 Tax=Geodermatophilus maliterrae TaxID=3162531 RepID=A0ABV3XH54_9ACTN